MTVINTSDLYPQEVALRIVQDRLSAENPALSRSLVRKVVLAYFEEVRRIQEGPGAPNFSVDGGGCDL